jgi:hypothetical protein
LIPSFEDYSSVQGGQSLPLPVFTEHPQIALLQTLGDHML